MCEDYDRERRLVIFFEQRDEENGKPFQCDAMGGYFRCDSRDFTYVFRHPKSEKGRGWECDKCGKFFRSKENSKEYP